MLEKLKSLLGIGTKPEMAVPADNVSVHQSEPEIAATKQEGDVVINDVPASEPIATVPDAETAA